MADAHKLRLATMTRDEAERLLAVSREADFVGADAAGWLERLTPERGNFLDAVRFFAADGEDEPGPSWPQTSGGSGYQRAISAAGASSCALRWNRAKANRRVLAPLHCTRTECSPFAPVSKPTRSNATRRRSRQPVRQAI